MEPGAAGAEKGGDGLSEAWCILWARSDSSGIGLTSNIADEEVADMMILGYEGRGFEVLAVCPEKELVEAVQRRRELREVSGD